MLVGITVGAAAPMRKLSTASAVSESPEGAAFDGWLQKRGQFNTALQKRYFLLHGACLTYFESVDAANKGKASGQATVAKVGLYDELDAPELSDRGESFRVRKGCHVSAAHTVPLPTMGQC